MDNCCDSLLNKLLCIFNFFFLLTGIALIAIGTYIHIEMADYLNYFDDKYANATILFIILGTVILIIGFFGCCGACTENSCMMFTFAFLLSLVVIVEIGAAIAVYLFRGDATQVITKHMTEGLNNFDQGDKYQGVTDTWNAVQSDFKCCGVKNYTDWKDTNYGKKVDGVPDTCCETASLQCGKDAFTKAPNGIYKEGCLVKLQRFVVENVAVIGGIGVGIAVLQIIGVLLSCMLAVSMRRRQQRVDFRRPRLA